jgi:hypothetical protein
MSTQYPLTIDEFLEAVRPELEYQVDQMICAQPLPDRLVLMRHREQILERVIIVNKIANLEHRLAEAEARLRPRLVYDEDAQ